MHPNPSRLSPPVRLTCLAALLLGGLALPAMGEEVIKANTAGDVYGTDSTNNRSPRDSILTIQNGAKIDGNAYGANEDADDVQNNEVHIRWGEVNKEVVGGNNTRTSGGTATGNLVELDTTDGSASTTGGVVIQESVVGGSADGKASQNLVQMKASSNQVFGG